MPVPYRWNSIAERERFLATLARMRSDFDGEKTAAACAIVRMLDRRGIDFDDILVDLAAPVVDPSERNWRLDLALCRRHREALNAWEAEFTASLAERRAVPSAKQCAILRKIADALRERGAA